MAEAQNTGMIEAQNQKLAEAFRKHDFAAVGEMHTADAVMLAPGSNIIVGKGNIQSFWEQRGRELRDVRFETLSVKPVGDNAVVEVGTFRMRMDAPSTPLDTEGAPQSRGITAKYVSVWQKVADDWKIGATSWNRIGARPAGRLTRGQGGGGRLGQGGGGRLGQGGGGREEMF
jgi:ketosteroid isomerase-like protein